MLKRLPTGRNEVGMLSDIREVAEKVGTEVFGFPIEWFVETEMKTGKRPDVEVRRADTNELIASGEAKKPETSEGLHPYVASEVNGAVAKAKGLGGRFAFTTNFIAIALFDATLFEEGNTFSAMVGDEIPLVDEVETTTPEWWKGLTKERREALVKPGLETLFTELRTLRAQEKVEKKIGKDEVYLSIFKASTDAIVAEATPAFFEAQGTLQLPESVLVEAEERGFKELEKSDVGRYYVAQAVAEVLTSGLFYETVRPNFSLRAILSGQRPISSEKMRETLLKNLAEATKQTGDYETIFGLSAGAQWVLGIESASLRNLWLGLFDALDGIRFDEVTSDIIGVIFERLISAERRQDMGQHYTQSRLARAMTTWAIQSKDDVAVDFSAGGGTFLVEAYTRLREFKAHESVLEQVFGNDLDSFAVHLSTVNLATRDVYKGRNFPAVSNRDGMSLRPGDLAVQVTPTIGEPYELAYPDRFDVVLGNPPYDEKADTPTRYRTDLAEVAGDGGTSVLPQGMPDHVNLATWFMLLGAAWLKPGGRLALVLPASILQNEKHLTVVGWLRRRFDISIWHTESDVWFSDARVAPVALFATPRKDTSADHGRFYYVNVHEPVSGDITVVDGFPLPVEKHTVRDLSGVSPELDAIVEGTRPDVLRTYEKSPALKQLNKLTGVTVFSGNKLGHPFFKLKDRDPASTSVTRSLVGWDIQTKLPRKHLTPLLTSPKNAPTGEFTPEGNEWWILSAPEKVDGQTALGKYIAAVRRAGAADQPSVKAKGKNWWSVPWKTTRVSVAAHPAFGHAMWWGSEPYIATNNVQALGFDASYSKDDQELVAASMASVFGALSMLYRSNEVGCEGVRWVTVQKLEGWYVLNPSEVSAEHAKAVRATYREFRKMKTEMVFEMKPAAKAAWKKLSLAVAKAAKLTDPEKLVDAALSEADSTTWRRREREIAATAGRTRAGASGGNKLVRDIKNATETSERFREVVDALTNGDATLKLKSQEVDNALFDIDGESEKQRLGNELTAFLGEGFEAAPVWEDATVESVETLFSVVEMMFVSPGEDGTVPQSLSTVLETIRANVRKTLATAVKKRLT